MQKKLPNRGGAQQPQIGGIEQGHKSRTAENDGNPGSTGNGRGWHGDSKEHAEVGRLGGETVSRDRQHMAEIGRKGGEAVSKDRRHMAAIGQKGGEASGGSAQAASRAGNAKPEAQNSKHR
jgi:general stress protein YciG